MKEYLQKHQIQVTKQRILILKALKSADHALTIDEILQKIDEPINHTTLYRSLALFVQKGLVYQTDFRKGVAYYEFQEDGQHHHHLVCTSCGKTDEIDLCPLSSLKKIESEKGFIIKSHHFELFGLCLDCQE